MHTGWEVAVLIPARDEEALLARCIKSIRAAVKALPASIRAQIILVSDSSTDRTTEIARNMLRKCGTVLTTSAGSVGTARALAASHAIRHARSCPCQLWLANTDADCIVPPEWLVDQLTLAHHRVEAVAGIVTVDSFDEHGAEVPSRFRASYLIGRDGTHPHVHGANLGVRADRYLAAGGWADLKTAEDHDLWRRLRVIGTNTLSSARVYVATSGRRVGRAPHGFAEALAAHNTRSAAA